VLVALIGSLFVALRTRADARVDETVRLLVANPPSTYDQHTWCLLASVAYSMLLVPDSSYFKLGLLALGHVRAVLSPLTSLCDPATVLIIIALLFVCVSRVCACRAVVRVDCPVHRPAVLGHVSVPPVVS
jgi:hypothetical protein